MNSGLRNPSVRPSTVVSDRQHTEYRKRAQAQAQESRARVLAGHAVGRIAVFEHAHAVAVND